MGCTTAKPSSNKHGTNEIQNITRWPSYHIEDPVQEDDIGSKIKKPISSPDLAYQFIQMMAKQQQIEEINNQKEKELGFHSCPKLSIPEQSSLIKKRIRKSPAECAAMALHLEQIS